ncbi:MAG: caspase family protein [Candidatus Melainabacteria bacterium]|nr:caspase family protein [Candidatus Melainabacteria bacterium]
MTGDSNHQKSAPGWAGLVIAATLVLLSSAGEGYAGEKGVFSEKTPVTVESKLRISREEAGRRLQELSGRLAELEKELAFLVSQHLQSAETYDLDSFKRHDDEISRVHDAIDSTILDMQALSERLGLPASYLATSRENIRKSKMLMYKSSSVFYLCFGEPVRSQRCARLGIEIGRASPGLTEYLRDMFFYLGVASFWSGDYTQAEKDLQNAMAAGTGSSGFTRVEPGTPVDLTGQNPFASHYLGSVYIARGEHSKAIAVLSSARETAATDELRGQADTLIALSHCLNGHRELADTKLRQAGTELASDQQKTYPAVARESLGLVAALAGDYRKAELELSKALPGLEDSPVKLGNRLEAAQAALWRSYCREKLGNSAGSQQDREYAMALADEAPHIVRLSEQLDRLFDRKTAVPTGERIREKWALVVGVGNFADPNIPKLRYSAKDARDMAEFLVKHAGFKSDHVRILVDGGATREKITDGLSGSWLPTVSKPGDLVFLFISSHGTPAYRDIGALNSVVTYDTRLDGLFETAVPMQGLVRMLTSKLPKRYTFAVLDTCYSGGLDAPGDEAKSLANINPDLMLGSSYQLLASSSDSNERSWESKRYPNSIFTRQLIDSVLENPGNDDFHFLFSEIRKRVANEVAADYTGNTQTPRLAGRSRGNLLMQDRSPGQR